MAKSFLGKGWKFPMGVDRAGNISTSELEENIEDNIRIIIGTAPGERVMRPDFGCAIHDLVFSPINVDTLALASYYVKDSLSCWEFRIDNIDVEAEPDPDQENCLQLSITYNVRSTNHIQNLVYPFYLRREEEA